MAKTSEPALGLAVMQVLATRPNNEASVRELVRHVPEYVNLTPEDREPSDTRPPEEMWEQRVRNLKSHDKTPGNVIGGGFVEQVGRGLYRLTEAGRLHLKHKGLI
jgi:Mrr N-terminal domain